MLHKFNLWFKDHLKLVSKIVIGLGALIALILNADDLRLRFIKSAELSGEWRLKFKTTKTTYKPFLNTTIEYRVYFNQIENVIEGDGEAIKYQGESLPPSQRVRLTIKGTVVKDSIFCNYTFYGSKRTTTGQFRAKHSENELVGRYSGNAASASGEFSGSLN